MKYGNKDKHNRELNTYTTAKQKDGLEGRHLPNKKPKNLRRTGTHLTENEENGRGGKKT